MKKVILIICAVAIIVGVPAWAAWQILDITQGGTGFASCTDGGGVYGSGTAPLTCLGVATNGQIPIGDGATDPVLATITGTANEITVTNGAGSITLDLPTSITVDVTGALTGAASGNILNSESDIFVGTLTGDGLTLGANENITLGAETLDHDGTDFVFSDTISVSANSISAAELDEGDTFTWTGTSHLFAGVTNLTIPAVADAAGEIAIDPTTDTFRIYDTAERVFDWEREYSGTVASTTFQIYKDILMKAHKKAVTITDIECRVVGGTSVVIFISDGTNDTESITCATTSTEDDGSIANGTFTAREAMHLEISTITGTVDWLNLNVTFTIDAD